MVIEQFKVAMATRDIIPPSDLMTDGRLHRCDAAGKNGRNDASYLLHLDGCPAGGFENHRDGQGWQDWRARNEPSAKQTCCIRAEVKQASNELRQRQAQEKARHILAKARPATHHPYLIQKHVPALPGVKTSGSRLILPLQDAAGAIQSLQFINGDGKKRFLAGGRKQGGYFLIGTPVDALCIAEGYATAASIHEATGHAVAVAFDAGNLQPVAEALRTQWPRVRIVVCADDDWQTDGNPGLTQAKRAAQAVDGVVAIPRFGNERASGDTDFNDLALRHGLEAVKAAIEVALKPETIVTPPPETPTAFDYGGGRFEVSPNGVFFIGTDKDGNEQPPRWICSPLSVVAMTRDAQSGAWGRLLQWRDADGVSHQWAMPLELLQGDGSEVRRELARLGLSIAPGKTARDLLASCLQVWPVKMRARCVDRLGWHGDVYVTPAQSIGAHDEIVVFQNLHALEPAFSISGTVASWRDSVAMLAAGNSRVMFAIAAALAGSLLEMSGIDSGGFHFRGASSCGKSISLLAASSVWGRPQSYRRMWRVTTNGLEGLAALHNDGVLILDELGQLDPKEAGEAAYLLANGQGKTRASRTGTARQAMQWRLLLLSAGEESLPVLMARAGRRVNVGQEIRLAEIEADAGAGIGIFEMLNGQGSPAALAEALKSAAAQNHGAPGAAWLRRVVTGRPALAGFIAKGLRQFEQENVRPGASGQVIRVARRFGLAAIAGELASHYGLTGWLAGEAEAAAKTCFAAWLEGFGGVGEREKTAMLAQVRAFFEAHGSSRFEDVNATGEQRISNRAGFFRTTTSGERAFLVLLEAFKREICQGFDARAVTTALLEAGWLDKGSGGKNTKSMRLPGMGVTRCYVFNDQMWRTTA